MGPRGPLSLRRVDAPLWGALSIANMTFTRLAQNFFLSGMTILGLEINGARAIILTFSTAKRNKKMVILPDFRVDSVIKVAGQQAPANLTPVTCSL